MPSVHVQWERGGSGEEGVEALADLRTKSKEQAKVLSKAKANQKHMQKLSADIESIRAYLHNYIEPVCIFDIVQPDHP